MNAAAFLGQLQALLPLGPAWTRDPGAGLTRLLEGLADELARVDARGENLLFEADPRTTDELLTDWERVVGIPDECAGIGGTLEARQLAVFQKLSELGGQNAAYYVGIAVALGFTATVQEYSMFVAGDHAGDLLYGEAWLFHFTIDVSAEAGDVDRALLECVIGRARPAHTTVNFTYP